MRPVLRCPTTKISQIRNIQARIRNETGSYRLRTEYAGQVGTIEKLTNGRNTILLHNCRYEDDSRVRATGVLRKQFDCMSDEDFRRLPPQEMSLRPPHLAEEDERWAPSP